MPVIAPTVRHHRLHALLYHLGGEVFALPDRISDDPPIARIGSFGGLPAWSVLAPAHEVLRQARQLARRGRLGLVLGESDDQLWFAAITLQPVRLIAVPAATPDALPLRRLRQAARASRDTPLETAVMLADALDADAAGRRTFALLHRLLERGIQQLPGRVTRDDRHAWVLMQLTRLLFLRFVESEGWLNGNPRFLAENFDRCLLARRDPARHLLHPLFFGSLNRPWHARSRFARAFGAIPFLNGGLFEPHAIERAHRLHLPVDYWRDVFAALVDRVDVTLDNAEDGRVTPELLGRVFEGVMHPEERKQQGTFFTPPALVDVLLRTALAEHCSLRWRMSPGAAERALDDPDAITARRLLDVTVLDPAVGSGAFLVSALALLHGPGARQSGRLRHLLTRRLFGVDLHPGATRLTELRLWLDVLRAQRGVVPATLAPLPNLDASIRAGDALIDPLHGQTMPASAVGRLRDRHRALRTAHGTAKRSALLELRRSERTAVLAELAARDAALDRQIREVLAQARTPTLFGEPRRLDTAGRRDLAGLRHQWREIRMQRRRLRRDATAAPFAIATAFAPVLARRGGFDLVVGNPPWVRAERLAPATRLALAERYRWWRSAGGRTWHHLPDLAVAFVERSHSLLARDGTMALLLPAKLATATYAAVCREALVSRAMLHCVADLADDPRAGFDATTYPLAMIASRRAPAPDHCVRFALDRDAPAQPQRLWHGAAPWIVCRPDVQQIAARLREQHPSLAGCLRPQLGVKTGANRVFLDPPAELHAWCRWAVRGRDVRPFIIGDGVRLLWPADHRGTPWRGLPPALQRYFASAIPRLQRRADQHRGPVWQLFRTRAATAPHRVIWRDLAPQLQAAVVRNDDAIPLNTCYVVAAPTIAAADSLAAWLNATPIRALARLSAEAAAGGCARFGARAVGGVPLPRQALGHPALGALTHAAVDHAVQATLDDYVGDLLGLSAVEREALDAVATRRR